MVIDRVLLILIVECPMYHSSLPHVHRVPRVFRVALRDVAFLYALLLLRSMATGSKRPGAMPPLRTLSFCVAAFSTIRVRARRVQPKCAVWAWVRLDLCVGSG